MELQEVEALRDRFESRDALSDHELATLLKGLAGTDDPIKTEVAVTIGLLDALRNEDLGQRIGTCVHMARTTKPYRPEVRLALTELAANEVSSQIREAAEEALQRWS